MRKFITIFGQKGNGKTTLAQFLRAALNEQKLGYWCEHSFAQPLKDIVEETTGLTQAQINEWKNKDEPPPGLLVPVRYYMIEIAKVIRSAKPTAFIDIALEYTDQSTPFIIDDGRFENEAVATKEAGGYNIFITRPEKAVLPYQEKVDDTERWCGQMATRVLKGHEDGWDMSLVEKHFHHIIVNNSTLDNLQDVANQLVYKLTRTYLTPTWDGK